MTGHMMGAAGAFEAFATVMSVAEQCAPGHAQLPRLRPGLRPVGPGRDRPDADPLRALEQHRARRPQRRGHLQALRRRLTTPRRRGRAYNPTPMPERDPARRAVVTGLGAVMPIGNDFPTYWANLQAGVTGTRTIRCVRRLAAGGPDRGRGPRLRPGERHGSQDGPPDEPVHPPRDGRRQGGRRRLRDRLRGDDAGATRPGRGRREHRRRWDRADHRRHPRPRPEGPALRVAVRDPGAVGLDGRRPCCRWNGA